MFHIKFVDIFRAITQIFSYKMFHQLSVADQKDTHTFHVASMLFILIIYSVSLMRVKYF